jgi:hypothetical protein
MAVAPTPPTPPTLPIMLRQSSSGGGGSVSGGWTDGVLPPPLPPRLSSLPDARREPGTEAGGGDGGGGGSTETVGENPAIVNGGAWDDLGEGSQGSGTTAYSAVARARGTSATGADVIRRRGPPALAAVQRGAQAYLRQAVQSGRWRAARAFRDAQKWAPQQGGAGGGGGGSSGWWPPQALLLPPAPGAHLQARGVGGLLGPAAAAPAWSRLGGRR